MTWAYLATKPEYASEKVNMAITVSACVFVGNYYRKFTGKWIYNIGVNTVVRLMNNLLIKSAIYLITLQFEFSFEFQSEKDTSCIIQRELKILALHPC